MLPSFIPQLAQNLTEDTSIALIQQIQRELIPTTLSKQPIGTTYTRQGKGGTPILLLHGFDSSLLEFRRLLPLLAKEQETWAVDLLGLGFCDRPADCNYNPSTIKTHLYSLWQTLIKRPVILVGASMGGATAIDFTLTYPEAVAQLILIDSAGLAKPAIASKLMFPPLDYLATAFLRNPKVRQKISESAYYNPNFANDDALLCSSLHLHSPNWGKALISFTKSGGYNSFADQIHQIQQFTLIIWGQNDRILGTKDASRFTELLPNHQLVWIENCGHVPHLEQPQVTAQKILDHVLEITTI